MDWNRIADEVALNGLDGIGGPEQAAQMCAHGATVVCLGAPAGLEFGVDLKSWNVGTNFQGIKMIPPGVHVCCWAAPNARGGLSAPRTSVWWTLTGGQVVVLRWSPETEDFILLGGLDASGQKRWNIGGGNGTSNNKDLADYENVLVAVKRFELDRRLGPYPLDQWRAWRAVTSHVGPLTLRALQSPCGRISSIADELPAGYLDVPERPGPIRPSQVSREAASSATASTTTTTTNEDMMSEASDSGVVQPSSVPSLNEWAELFKPQFSVVRQRHVPAGASAAEVTRNSLDRSSALDLLLQEKAGLVAATAAPAAVTPAQARARARVLVLGEVQYAFCCFLVGHTFAGLEQWKRLVTLLCQCDRAARDQPLLFVDFFAVLGAQLDHAPGDLFDDVVTNDNFLGPALAQLFESVLDDQDHWLAQKLGGRTTDCRGDDDGEWRAADGDDDSSDDDADDGAPFGPNQRPPSLKKKRKRVPGSTDGQVPPSPTTSLISSAELGGGHCLVAAAAAASRSVSFDPSTMPPPPPPAAGLSQAQFDQAAHLFRRFCVQRFGAALFEAIDADQDDDEYLPVIVTL